MIIRVPRKLNTETVALANADYEDRKESGEYVTYKIIERFWKLRAGQLFNYRSNRFRRKDSGVTEMFTSNAGPIALAIIKKPV